jgi:uncharacterized glyoxalase superfamily protein PhnB
MSERPTLASAISYREPEAALKFLEAAFGFEPVMIIRDAGGALVHSEMTLGNGLIMVGNEWDESHKSPASLGANNTQSVHVHIASDIDGHCDRARQAGAVIEMAPTDQFYGDRTYRARDLEGHIWTFGQTVRAMKASEWDKSGQVKTWVRPGSAYDG